MDPKSRDNSENQIQFDDQDDQRASDGEPVFRFL